MINQNIKCDRIPPSRMATRHLTRVGWRGSEVPGAGSRLADGQTSCDVVSRTGARLADGQISGDPDAPLGLRGEAGVDVGQPWLPLAKAVAKMRPPGLSLAKARMKMRPTRPPKGGGFFGCFILSVFCL